MNKLNFQAPITTNTGYGITSTNILKSLIELNVDIALFPIGDVTLESVEDKNLIEPIFQKTQVSYNQNDPNLKIWHQFDLSARVGSGTYGALVFFEIDKMNPVEVNMMNLKIIQKQVIVIEHVESQTQNCIRCGYSYCGCWR